ncbi:MAG: PD-(D/E)XK nuclease family protein [Candidatus Nucleicultricaceae bacterium]
MLIENRLDAKPFSHPNLEQWRKNSQGIRFHHLESNILLYGAIDDVWINAKDEIIVVDYKATSKDKEVGINEEWQTPYKRQMEVYIWLFQQNNFNVSSVGYFVYCNGVRNKEFFEKKLEFSIALIPYQANTLWIDGRLLELKMTLTKNHPPKPSEKCSYCSYIEEVRARS